ncbi:MAG: 23S rRNA (guanosine(2251)-2'-O)-methyltransferase RlmB [Candidatus Aminicenantes bacterium]|nr:23S rRNA (guanosine(2251)-2'-O)-methyltransferase RlmB [Candidatus Aminicenantes bacterium]
MAVITSLNALTEALRDGAPVHKVLIRRERRDAKVAALIDLCRRRKVVFQLVPAAALERKAGPRNQGVWAEVSPVGFARLEDVLAAGGSGLVVVLDGIEDTGNLGAIVRTAAAVEADGVLFPARGSAPVNDTVWKTSAGALAKVRLVPSRNLAQDIEKLKKNGFWVVAADRGSRVNFTDFDFRGRTAVILGNESKGVSTLLKRNADQLLAVPHSPAVESLNVAAAAAIILYEAYRQKKQ